MDSEQTARSLERAALELLARDGVLKGLNLREVADHAGVNRALVYHYFGSRRDLLRAALRHNVRQRIMSVRMQDEPLGFGDRMKHALRGCIRYVSMYRLVALLVLDGDSTLRLMPDLPRTQQRLKQDQAEGALDPEIDPVALHAMMVSLSLGYPMARTQLAKEFGLGVRELDERMFALAERLGPEKP
ncbi:transcriptional regulator, TetR family [Saccharopolyspora shandongensis]|uniref:Transcriptional regulator, TetR family n=2 Tax=Saccharopolyspora shandongensis TaxID=418495 RepID=A0A1H3EJK3_9PSEU|nr:transcriptional regulator, TetR family [Saccharopolyspora shandongensis]